MAVDSSNKKNSKTGSKKKTNNKITKDIVKEETIDKEPKEKTNDDIKEEKLEPENKNINVKWLILTPIVILLIFTEYIIFPKIRMLDNPVITINYNDKYIEPGYKATILNKDITNNVITNSNVDNTKIGVYHVSYQLKYGFITIKKERVVNVIDDIPPVISEVDDEIKICPNETVEEIPYKVIDEYDGDITDNSTITYLEDKIIIDATDKSNNSIKKEIKINVIDDEKPIITLKGNSTMYLSYGTSYIEPGYTASDNCDGDITSKVTVSGSVGSSIGTYKLTYSITDNASNKEEVSRTVIVRNNNLYNSGTIGNGVIYLTFDDGPSNGTTNVILDILKEESIKATFFVTCNGPDSLIKRMYNEGHTVALHTATHNYAYVYSSVDNYFEDLNRVGNRVKNITGIDSKIIRFPGGSSNTISRNYQYGIMTTLTSMVVEKGYRYFDWNVDSMDAGGARSSSDVYNNVTRNLSKNRSNVVLMHDIKPMTRDALRNIIRYAKGEGYTFSRIENDTYMVRHSVNN